MAQNEDRAEGGEEAGSTRQRTALTYSTLSPGDMVQNEDRAAGGEEAGEIVKEIQTRCVRGSSPPPPACASMRARGRLLTP